MSNLPVTIEGKTFPIDVPDDVIKRKDTKWVEKAAREHYNQHYATGLKDAQLPTVNGPDLTQTTEFKESDKYGKEGFLSSLGKSFHGMVDHPLDTIRNMMPTGYQYDPDNLSDPNNPGSPKHDWIGELPFKESVMSAVHGNLPAAAGSAIIPAAMMMAASPKVRGAVAGGMRGLADAATDVNINAKRNSLPAVIGGTAGAFTHGWPGFLAGSGVGAMAPEIPGILKEGIRGAIVGASGKPLIPQVVGEPNYNINKPHPIDISNSTPGRNMPPGLSEGFNAGGQPPERMPLVTPPPSNFGDYQSPPLQLNQAPIITPPPVSRPPLQLGPATQDFYRGSGSEPDLDMMMRGVNPGAVAPVPNPENPAMKYGKDMQDSMRSLLDSKRVESLPKVVPPKIETQQVPANTKSVTEELPSSLSITPETSKPNPAASALKAAKSVMKKVDFKPHEKTAEIESKKAPSDTEVWDRLDKAFPTKNKGGKLPEVKPPNEVLKNKPNEVTTPKSDSKPHFTHETMGKIAKSVSDANNKVTLQEVGRYIHENDLGSYQEGKFDKTYGAGKSTKTELSSGQKSTKAAKEKLIHQGILNYVKEHPHEF